MKRILSIVLTIVLLTTTANAAPKKIIKQPKPKTTPVTIENIKAGKFKYFKYNKELDMYMSFSPYKRYDFTKEANDYADAVKDKDCLAFTNDDMTYENFLKMTKNESFEFKKKENNVNVFKEKLNNTISIVFM